MGLKSILKRITEGRATPSDLAQSVKADGLTYLSNRKLARLETCLNEAKMKPGCFAEFGVAMGGSAILIAQAASQHDKVFHGFDVFATIPPPTSEHDGEKSRARYETIASGQSEGIDGAEYYGYVDDLLGKVKDSFARYDLPVDGDRIVMHEGLFEDTVPVTDLNDIAFCHIDCDWYDPVAYCLDVTLDRMSPGGVILLDDYHDYGGCKIAVDERLKARNDVSFEDGRNVILRKIA